MKSVFNKLAASAVFAATIFTSVPIAQAADDDPIAKAIKARQAGFRLYSYYAGTLFAMAKGDQDYDADLASTMASNLVAVTSLNNGMMWLPGSDNEARAGDTRAKPAIWAEGSDIGDKSKAIKSAAAALSEVAGSGLDALRGKIGDLGDACKGCHDDFRAKEF
jgi:cytochrome c556